MGVFGQSDDVLLIGSDAI